MNDPRTYTKTDIVERIENRRHMIAMELYNKIIYDLDPSGFTINDVVENFNAFTKVGDKHTHNTKRVRFEKMHLDYLTEHGLLQFDPETKQYCVNM
jgi:hypothetical protein